MNDRTIWIVRIIAVFILLLFTYLMISLYAKLQRMQGDRVYLESRVAATSSSPGREPGVSIIPRKPEPRSGDIVLPKIEGDDVAPTALCFLRIRETPG